MHPDPFTDLSERKCLTNVHILPVNGALLYVTIYSSVHMLITFSLAIFEWILIRHKKKRRSLAFSVATMRLTDQTDQNKDKCVSTCVTP